jgi:hypothetical protein
VQSEEFEHLLAAAAAVTGEEEFVVVASQAILGSVASPPPELLVSMEVDIYPLSNPEAAIQIDGSLGDGSPFHNSFGYYAHGVGPLTAKAPVGWQDRLVGREIPKRVTSKQKAVAWCLELQDLVLSKCVAGRDRDWRVWPAARSGLAGHAHRALIGSAQRRSPKGIVCSRGWMTAPATNREPVSSRSLSSHL